jgi:hypothetical protein
MKRRRYQYGSLTKKNNRLSEDVWQFRFYETTPEGRRYRRSTTIGTIAQHPTKTDALRIIEPLRLRLNLHHRFGRPGKFESSFALLDQLSVNIQDLRLDSLRRVLESEQTRKADSFEVIGIKFPSETTKWAGFVVLCGIQLYLWLLLRSQPTALAQKSSGEEVAWVGIYESLGARALVFTTTVPLPTFAFAATAFGKVTSRAIPWRTVGLSCASVAILGFSILTWVGLESFRKSLRTSRAAAEEPPKT